MLCFESSQYTTFPPNNTIVYGRVRNIRVFAHSEKTSDEVQVLQGKLFSQTM